MSTLAVVVRRRVSWDSVANDFECLLLGAQGLSVRAIADRLGYSKGQVAYRLRKGGVSVRSYREGKSAIARLVYDRTHGAITQMLRRALANEVSLDAVAVEMNRRLKG